MISLSGTQPALKSVLQLMFYATAAEALSSVQGEIEELSVAAEGEYRCAPFSLHPPPAFADRALGRKTRDH